MEKELSMDVIRDLRRKTDPNATASVVTGDVVKAEPIPNTPTDESTQNVID